MKFRHRVIRKMCGFYPEWLLIKRINHKSKSLHYPVVLMFHHILPSSIIESYLEKYHHIPSEVVPYSITPQKFEKIVKTLIDLGYSFDFEDDFRKRKGKVAIITFDDGYSDNYIYALAILQKYKIKASINLIANDICDSDDNEFLSISRIKTMLETGLFQFQAHTVSHPILTKCSDEECRKEIIDSKRIILEKTGINTSVFVYPCCQTNKKVADIVKRYYSLAYGGDDNEIDFIYRIPRIEITTGIDKKDMLRKILLSYYYANKQ